MQKRLIDPTMLEVSVSRAALLDEDAGARKQRRAVAPMHAASASTSDATIFWSIAGLSFTKWLSAGFLSLIAFTYGTCLYQVSEDARLQK